MFWILIFAAVQVAGMVWAWRWLGTSDATGDEDIRDGKRLFWSFLWPLVWLASWIGRVQ